MAAPPLPPTEHTTPPPLHGLRRLRRRLPAAQSLRRLGSIADVVALAVGIVVLTLAQLLTGADVSDPNILSLLVVVTFVVVGLHVVRAMPASGPPASASEPVDPPTIPAPPRTRRKSGRKRGVPTGFDRETAREQARRLRQMRREGTTWAEAARAVGLTEDQAKNVYRRFDDLVADDDWR